MGSVHGTGQQSSFSQSKAPARSPQNMKENARLLLAKYVDGWHQTQGKRKDTLGSWVI